jgi:hypothetical protein
MEAAPKRENSISGVFFFMSHTYSTFSAKIKALTCRESVATGRTPGNSLTVVNFDS